MQRGEEPNPATCRYLLAVDLLAAAAIVIYRVLGAGGGLSYMRWTHANAAGRLVSELTDSALGLG